MNRKTSLIKLISSSVFNGSKPLNFSVKRS